MHLFMKNVWKQTFLFISSVLTHRGAYWQCPLLDPEECSTKIIPESSQIPQISGA